MSKLIDGFLEAKELKENPILSADLETEDLKNKITKLNEKITKTKELKLSDITDKDGNQYIDLVMEGGVMLGLALVGYTYALESMGIRFYSIAGTSAGAINAALLTAWNGKNNTFASEWVLEEIAKKINDGAGFFDFVDIGEEKNDEELEETIKQSVKESLEQDKKYKAKKEQDNLIESLSGIASCFDGKGSDWLEGLTQLDNKITTLLIDKLLRLKDKLFKKENNSIDKIKFFAQTFLKINQKEDCLYRRGLCKGNVFRKWIEECVERQGINLNSEDGDDFIIQRNKYLMKLGLKKGDAEYKGKKR